MRSTTAFFLSCPLLFSPSRPPFRNSLDSLSPWGSCAGVNSYSRKLARTATTCMTTAKPAVISGPAWDLSDEYPSLSSPELLTDIDNAKADTAKIVKLAKVVAEHLPDAKNLTLSEVEAAGIFGALEEINSVNLGVRVLLGNVATFANCISSVDSSRDDAKKVTELVGELSAKYAQANGPVKLFLQLCRDEVAEKYLSLSPETRDTEFILKQSRKMRDHALSLDEENMLSAYAVPGISAWGALYTDLSSSLVVTVEDEAGKSKSMGVAAAAGLLDNSVEDVRRSAWLGIKQAWLPHTETCAAALNAISKWRLETYERRGLSSFLHMPLHQNKMEGKSLDAMMAAIKDNVEVGRRALRIQAAAMKKDCLEPWDLLAPAPVSESDTGRKYTYDEGIDVIADAVGAVDPNAGEFVRMMRDKKWIEAGTGDKKRPGAYCTGFVKSRNPRVYLSEYNGGASLLLTLAHELGHAFHSWKMRDLPIPQTGVGMVLAETASINWETLVAARLMELAESKEEKFRISWNNAQSAAVFLLNIPARFKFEKDMYVARASGKLSKGEIDRMMVEAWKEYYGDALGHLDEVGIFSATKLHFYISSLSFYNFPYSFGYLFALSVCASRARLGEKYPDMYVSLLRDTGRMMAEDVVEKHLGGKITERAFWEAGIDLVRSQVDEFEALAKELGYFS